MTKILIIGFQHSGTTLLQLLINAHPEVSKIFHEHRYIELYKPKEFTMNLIKGTVYPDGRKMAWGDKIPWIDGKGDRIIKLSKRWFKFFGKDARVIHILRHPLDVAYSISPIIKDQLKLIESSIPKVINFVNSDPRATTITFEDLVQTPTILLGRLFDFCKLKRGIKTIKKIMETELKYGKINPERAYAYKKQVIGVDDYDYNFFLRKLENQI